MGRGRAKAKQTKVARQLKYSSPGMDVDALQRELSGLSRREQEKPEYEDEYDEDEYRRR